MYTISPDWRLSPSPERVQSGMAALSSEQLYEPKRVNEPEVPSYIEIDWPAI